MPKLAPYRKKVVEYTQPLNLWQKLYFLALFVLAYQFFFNRDNFNYTLVGFLALAALSVEMWPKFVVFWESLLGRVIVVVTYAIVGNFVVAFARHQVNEVVGVDPSSFFYATSFVSILTAPAWIVTITLIVMLSYVLLRQVWYIVTFIPWLIGLYEKSQRPKVMFGKLTRLTRIVMMPFMAAFLISILELYGGSEESDAASDAAWREFSTSIAQGFNEAHAEAEQEKADAAKQISQELTDAKNQVAQELQDAGKQIAEGLSPEQREQVTEQITKASETIAAQAAQAAQMAQEPNSDGEQASTEPTEKPKGEVRVNDWTLMGASNLQELIAEFVYNIEAFAHSQCVMEENERVVSLGEYDILAVKPDKATRLGYSFTVRPCKLKEY